MFFVLKFELILKKPAQLNVLTESSRKIYHGCRVEQGWLIKYNADK
jgi:hypothetical protein